MAIYGPICEINYPKRNLRQNTYFDFREWRTPKIPPKEPLIPPIPSKYAKSIYKEIPKWHQILPVYILHQIRIIQNIAFITSKFLDPKIRCTIQDCEDCSIYHIWSLIRGHKLVGGIVWQIGPCLTKLKPKFYYSTSDMFTKLVSQF